MTYSIKEIFYTLQGEGAQAGRPAVFCRFAGCNLWSGREDDRATAVCRFCDTDFVGVDGERGGKFRDPDDLARAVEGAWPASHLRGGAGSRAAPYVVCTGGEPLLQLDQALVEALHARGFEVAIETNGTRAPPPGVDWICVSPKAGAELVLTSGDELKLIYPQEGAEPRLFEGLHFKHFFVQPMDGIGAAAGLLRKRNTELAVRFCMENPVWRLSLQTHKMLGIP